MQNKRFLSINSFSRTSFKSTLIALCVVFTIAGCSEKTTEEYIAEAKQFSENGNNPAAVVALKNAAQRAPNSADARFELGKLYLEMENYESAEKELSKAIELGYDEGVVTPMLARALQRTGANVALIDLEYDESRLTSAEQIEVGYRQINSLIQLDKEAEARALINKLLNLDTNTVYRGLVESYSLILDEELEKALEKAKEMYARAPLNQDVLNLTARLYQINGMGDEAANVYEDYIKVAPKDNEAKFSLAKMLVELRHPERAEKYIDELLEIAETNPYVNQLKGVVRASAGDYKNAKLYAENAIAYGRNDPSNRLVAGLSAYQLADYQAAIGHISLIASLLPDDHPGLRILAASQLKSNMGDDAGEILSRVQAVQGDDASLFSRAGYELIRSGNTEAAKEIIEQADKISESSEDLTRLGILKLSINDVEGLVDLENAVEKAPDSVTAKTTLANAYLGTAQFDKAMALAKQWQLDEPQSTDGLLLESEVLQRQNRLAEASVVINKALALAPDSLPVKLADIKLAVLNNDYDLALTKTEAVLDEEPTNLTALASYFALKNELKDPEPAINFIEKVAKDNPNDANLAILFSRIAVAFDRAEDALAALSNIKASRSTPITYWPVKGSAHVRANQADEALAHFSEWAKMYPNQESAVVGQLLMLDVKREYSKGADIATRFLERKDDLQVLIMQSYFLVMSGDLKRAKEVYASIDDKYKALPFLRGVKARIALLDNRPEDALEDALVAYDKNPTLNNLVVYISALDKTNNREGSLLLLENHVKKFPNDGRAKLLLGERQITSNEDEAITTYKEMLKKYPNNFVVLNNLAYLQMEAGKLDEAYRYASKAYEINSDNVAIVDTYAQVLIKRGEVKEAVELYNTVMNKDVNNDEITLNYIEALLKNDSKTIAKRRIDALVLTTEEGKARLTELQNEYLY